MECNKDEATRAKEIAERKIMAKDFAAAKKFALKAQNLYPELEGLTQMLATLDVYISAENKINGEADWYRILGVSPPADDETVRKQYRKLALILHPDKNKSVGADGAFKLISEAWTLLSDKSKKLAYDQKRNIKGFQPKVPPPSGGPSVQPDLNGFHNFSSSTKSNTRAPKSSTRVSPTPIPSRSSKPNTFWTACHRCRMQYEYLRVYHNHNLLCPNCHEPFLAIETEAPPANGSNPSTPWASSQQRQNSNHHTANKNAYATGRNTGTSPNVVPGGFAGPESFNNTKFQWGPFSQTAGVGSTIPTTSAATQAANVIHQAYERVKRECEQAHAAARSDEASQRKNHASKRSGSGLPTGLSSAGSIPVFKGERPAKKRRGLEDDGRSKNGGDSTNQMTMGNGRAVVGSVSGVRQCDHESERVKKPNTTRELSLLENRNMLMEKARIEIRKKLNEWSTAAVAKSADKGKEEKGKEKEVRNSEACDKNKVVESVDIKKADHCKKDSAGTFAPDSNIEAPEPMSISVPDPDFHDFDKDRSERSFGVNQVWAAYDDDDGMPRYYAMIHSILSLDPFKIRISWLNSKTTSELGPLNWVGCGFSKTCGDFRIGRYEVNGSLNSFSHRVSWTKGIRGAIRIFPRKGDVWALYRNWSPEWNELTTDEVIHKYDMVEVLDDYNEEKGVFVTPLVKVAGFKTVFHQHLDPGKVKLIPREEMFRFSHQVPSYLLTGQEAQNAPRGCRELDPAATPLELLQVITEAKEEEMVDSTGKATEEMVENAANSPQEKMVGNAGKTVEEVVVTNAEKAIKNERVEKGKEVEEEETVQSAQERQVC